MHHQIKSGESAAESLKLFRVTPILYNKQQTTSDTICASKIVFLLCAVFHPPEPRFFTSSGFAATGYARAGHGGRFFDDFSHFLYYPSIFSPRQEDIFPGH